LDDSSDDGSFLKNLVSLITDEWIWLTLVDQCLLLWSCLSASIP
jgi:hypothetical protein